MVVVGEGDSCVKKEESAAVEDTEEELCSEWTWRTEHKKWKNR